MEDKMTHEERRKRPEHHVVHDYANLVSSGILITDSAWNHKLYELRPTNSHVWHAFNMNCRKMFEFFTYPPKGRYFRAAGFMTVTKFPYTFAHWTKRVHQFM